MKASLLQPTSVLFGEYSTTIGLLQQNEKSTQFHERAGLFINFHRWNMVIGYILGSSTCVYDLMGKH